ncbi:MAG TPA: LLM class F420-dependent oxidoreductase [Acidimicrobiia bacterium]|nr:LLM class F420-dependent oxidoreductase [Acidimicrobiia bacterium]
MEIGLFLPVTAWHGAEYLKRVGAEAEARGIESVWVPEHVVLFDQYESPYPYSPDGKLPAPPEAGMVEPFTALTYLAAVTERLRLGTGISLLPQRQPVYTAKVVADLDWLSGGRVNLGVGVGWLREEYEVLGVPWEGRGARADDYLQILKTLWTDETSSFQGEVASLPECRMYPKPVQQPHPPIHVGGESDAALRRAARHGQGWYGFDRGPDEVQERLDTLEKFLAEEGRSRADFEVSICPYFRGLNPEMVEAFKARGVDRVITLFMALQPDDVTTGLEALVPCVEAAQG